MRFLEKSIKNFIAFAAAFIFFLITVTGIYFCIYSYSTLNTYNIILLILILLTIILTVVFILAASASVYVYKKKSAGPIFRIPVKVAMKILLPAIDIISGFLRVNKDGLRQFYIDLNNILVQSINRKYSADHVLLILPHCLQYAGCGLKITNDSNNCKRCGRCCIGDIAAIAEDTGVKMKVVTGGTAARNIVSKVNPQIIISVACERDLTAGIADVSNIPVIGVLNRRPNGPCYNTVVDVNILKQKLDDIIM